MSFEIAQRPAVRNKATRLATRVDPKAETCVKAVLKNHFSGIKDIGALYSSPCSLAIFRTLEELSLRLRSKMFDLLRSILPKPHR